MEWPKTSNELTGIKNPTINGNPIVFQHVKTHVDAMEMKSLKFGDDTLLRRMATFIRSLVLLNANDPDAKRVCMFFTQLKLPVLTEFVITLHLHLPAPLEICSMPLSANTARCCISARPG